jgi:hypothetical protein
MQRKNMHRRAEEDGKIIEPLFVVKTEHVFSNIYMPLSLMLNVKYCHMYTGFGLIIGFIGRL